MTLLTGLLPRPVTALHDAARHRAALVLRDKVAGADATDRATRIWGAEGERWFSPADPIWRVHLDASMFIGGIRALLLQALHPLAMAGVADFSSYRTDPWTRLQSTSNFISQSTFGTIQDATALLDRINAVHSHIHGTAPDGRPYSATDPHLLTWVHVAEIDAFLTCHQRYGQHPLSRHDADVYVRQTGLAARYLGVPDPPTDVASLRAMLESFRPELRLTPEAAGVLRFLTWQTPMSPLARPGYLALVAGAVGTLPDYALKLFGIPVPPGGRCALQLAGAGGAAGIRWVLSDPMVRTDRRLA